MNCEDNSTKQCNVCLKQKAYEFYFKSKRRKDGYNSACKECSTAQVVAWRKQNKDKVNLQQRNLRVANKQRYCEYDRKKRLKDPAKTAETQKKNYLKNIEARKRLGKDYYQKNKEKIKQRVKEYRNKNAQVISAKKYEYKKQRLKTDILYKLNENIACLIRSSLINRGYRKQSKTAQILGCTIEEFRKHLEMQFLPGMTWDNRKEWHIDHIMPISKAKNEEDAIKLNHFTNLRPLWADDNHQKSDNIIYLI